MLVSLTLSYSLFDFDQYGDEKYGAEAVAPVDPQQASQQQAQSQQSGQQSQQQSQQHPVTPQQQSVMRAERPLDGKLEKSFLNFKNAHPNYEASAGGNAVLNRLNAYKDLK